MNSYIVDDRLDLEELCKQIDSMSEEERKKYIDKYDRSKTPYNSFIDHTKDFLSGNSMTAKEYCNYVDQFWVDHEEDLEYSADPNDRNDENTIVSRIWELADRYDPCDEIVAHDPYCINEEQLREGLEKILNDILL